MVRTVPATLMAEPRVVVLLSGVPSPPVPLRKAAVLLVAEVLAGIVSPVVLPTVKLMVTAESLPAVIGVELVQVTTCSAAEQFQPVPVPLVKLKPVGRVVPMVKVGMPVGPGPALCAVMVNDPLCPRVKVVGECVIEVSEMSGRFCVKFRHQPPAMPPSPASSTSSCWYRLQVPFPLKVLAVVPPKTPAALTFPRMEVDAGWA